jgi:hypothetical protein
MFGQFPRCLPAMLLAVHLLQLPRSEAPNASMNHISCFVKVRKEASIVY